jgi:hypothetical protein
LAFLAGKDMFCVVRTASGRAPSAEIGDQRRNSRTGVFVSASSSSETDR